MNNPRSNLVHERMQAGKIPSGRLGKMWGGYGDGAACAGCQQAIGKNEIEYDQELEDGRSVRMHAAPCWQIWSSRMPPRDTARIDAFS